MSSIERWLPVVSYEGLYEVSDRGRVRSLPRRTHVGMRGGKIVTPYVDDHGYLRVSLWRNGKRARWRVHRIVSRAFIGPRPAGQEVLHGPLGPLDNSLANLSYGPHAQNVGPDQVRDGTGNCGEYHGLAKLTWMAVEDIRARVAAGESQTALAREYNVNRTTVWKIIHNRNWRRRTTGSSLH